MFLTTSLHDAEGLPLPRSKRGGSGFGICACPVSISHLEFSSSLHRPSRLYIYFTVADSLRTLFTFSVCHRSACPRIERTLLPWLSASVLCLRHC